MPAQSSNAKTVLITLTGVDKNKLRKFAKNDHLPFFNRLLSNCTSLPTTSIFPASEPVDLLCGTSPAMHGYYAKQQLNSGKYTVNHHYPSAHASIPFTKCLGEKGFKSLLIDVAFAELAAESEGVTILDSQSTSLSLTESSHLHPIKKLLSHAKVSSNSDAQSITDPTASPSLAAKIKFTKLVLTEHAWDLAYIDLGDSWHKNGAHQEHEEGTGTDSQHHYQVLDRAITEITQHLCSDDNIIIISRSKCDELPHQKFIEPVLCQLGLLKLNETVARDIDQPCPVETANGGLKHRIKGLLWPVRSRLNRLFTPSRIVWEETRAFQLPGDRNSYLRINMLGREPQGIVTPGVEYDGLLLGIAAELNGLTVEPSGQKAIKNISFPRRDMSGPHHDMLPDIAIEWNIEVDICGLQSSTISLSTETNVDQLNQFDTSGFILVAGENIHTVQQNADVDIRSIASTVLALFNIEQPQTYDLPSLVKHEDAASKSLQQVAS